MDGPPNRNHASSWWVDRICSKFRIGTVYLYAFLVVRERRRGFETQL